MAYIDASINDVSIKLIQINAPGTELPGLVNQPARIGRNAELEDFGQNPGQTRGGAAD